MTISSVSSSNIRLCKEYGSVGWSGELVNFKVLNWIMKTVIKMLV